MTVSSGSRRARFHAVYIEFHKDDDVNRRQRNERREPLSSGMMISTELAEPESQVLARSLVSGPGS